MIISKAKDLGLEKSRSKHKIDASNHGTLEGKQGRQESQALIRKKMRKPAKMQKKASDEAL
jgi:hypothetical protein